MVFWLDTAGFFLGLHPRHMQISRLGVESELQLLAYATATATQHLSWVCDLTTTHGNARSLTHWVRPGIEAASSWLLVRLVSAVPQWESIASFNWGFFFFFFCLFDMSGLLASFAPSLGHMRQKENPGNSPQCCYLDTQVPSKFIFLSPTFGVILCLLYILFPCFSLHLVGDIGKTVPIASFWMWTVLKLWQIFSFHLPVWYRILKLIFGHSFIFFQWLSFFCFEGTVFSDGRIRLNWNGSEVFWSTPFNIKIP